MTYDDHLYHSEREKRCRELAEAASDPEIRRRHAELADLHANRAATYMPPPVVQVNAWTGAQ